MQEGQEFQVYLQLVSNFKASLGYMRAISDSFTTSLPEKVSSGLNPDPDSCSLRTLMGRLSCS